MNQKKSKSKKKKKKKEGEKGRREKTKSASTTSCRVQGDAVRADAPQALRKVSPVLHVVVQQGGHAGEPLGVGDAVFAVVLVDLCVD